jgi:TPR repeat protein
MMICAIAETLISNLPPGSLESEETLSRADLIERKATILPISSVASTMTTTPTPESTINAMDPSSQVTLMIPSGSTNMIISSDSSNDNINREIDEKTIMKVDRPSGPIDGSSMLLPAGHRSILSLVLDSGSELFRIQDAVLNDDPEYLDTIMLTLKEAEMGLNQYGSKLKLLEKEEAERREAAATTTHQQKSSGHVKTDSVGTAESDDSMPIGLDGNTGNGFASPLENPSSSSSLSCSSSSHSDAVEEGGHGDSHGRRQVDNKAEEGSRLMTTTGPSKLDSRFELPPSHHDPVEPKPPSTIHPSPLTTPLPPPPSFGFPFSYEIPQQPPTVISSTPSTYLINGPPRSASGIGTFTASPTHSASTSQYLLRHENVSQGSPLVPSKYHPMQWSFYGGMAPGKSYGQLPMVHSISGIGVTMAPMTSPPLPHNPYHHFSSPVSSTHERISEQTIANYRSLANQGYAEAQYNLAYCYENGINVPKSWLEAFNLYKLAASQGHPKSQYTLGTWYDRGYHVMRNEYEAVKYYRLAAHNSYQPAQCNLAFCYYRGLGVEQDIKEAVRLYKQAADKGYAAAQYNLGIMYERGHIEKNLYRAVVWYERATEQRYPPALFALGRCYENGQGVAERDEKKAVDLYRKAANLGLSDAQYRLAYCYENGIGVEEKKLEEAFRFYKQAASQGHARSQCSLGFCYQYGIGVVKDEREAVKMYRMAVENGYDKAKSYLVRYQYEKKERAEQLFEVAVNNSHIMRHSPPPPTINNSNNKHSDKITHQAHVSKSSHPSTKLSPSQVTIDSIHHGSKTISSLSKPSQPVRMNSSFKILEEYI